MIKNNSQSKPNGVILYLARSSQADVADLIKSLKLLRKNFLKRFSYPVIVFVEESFTSEWKKLIQKDAGIRCRFETVRFEVPSFLAGEQFPEYVLEPKFKMGYRHMCRFFSGVIYRHPALRDFKWYWRLDTDSFVFGRVKYDPFKFMQKHGLRYGYPVISEDNPVVTEGLWDVTKKYIREKGIEPAFLSKYLDERGDWNRAMFYTNFEISDLDFWRSEAYQDYFDRLDRSGGIYRHRWGDAPIHLLGVAMLMPEEQTHRFQDIPYQHQNFVIDPDKDKWYRRVHDRVRVFFKRFREDGTRASLRRYRHILIGAARAFWNKKTAPIAAFLGRLRRKIYPVFEFRHKTCDYSTHQPVLYELIRRTKGPILELGCGNGSTPLLSFFARGREIVTVDNDPEWFASFRSKYQSKNHQFILTDDWDKILSDPLLDRKWSLIFVDQSPWEARHRSILRFRDTAGYLVLHDSDYFPLFKVFGTVLEETVPSKKEGRRDYSDIFRYFREYYPPMPWPGPTGPPTLVGSNLNNCDLNVDFNIERVCRQ